MNRIDLLGWVLARLPSRRRTAAAAARAWPRIHLIYFALAFFDLVAVGGGLSLSYALTSHYANTMTDLRNWDRQVQAIWHIRQRVADVGLPASRVFRSGDRQKESDALELAILDLNLELSNIKGQLPSSLEPALAAKVQAMIVDLEHSAQALVEISRAVLGIFALGDTNSAIGKVAALAEMQDGLFLQLAATADTLRQSLMEDMEQRYTEVRQLKNNEYLIGAAILFMVLAVVVYGHMVGRLISRKYEEIAEAHDSEQAARAEAESFAARVAAVNEDVVRLNADLAHNLAMLREAQDDSLRKGKMAQLGQLTATVAHELRNPLGAVRTSAFLLARKVKDKGLGIEPQIERINNGITRCDNIISQLLDFARSKGIQPEMIGFDEWLTKLIEEEAQRLPASVAIECRLGLGDVAVPFDPARMGRALINLLNNASEALVGKGDEPSKFTTRSPLITVTTRMTPRGVELSFADNGPGIAPEHLGKIFEPLFTTKNFGTGLGLSAVAKIMEQHGGGIEASSTPGQGAVFSIWWPLAPGELRAA